MAYSLVTNVNGPRGLLGELAIFANAQGWVVEYDNSAVSVGNGGQIALSSGECHIAIGEQSATANPYPVTDTLPTPAVNYQDGRIFMALSNSIDTGISQYWGHPGSIVTGATDQDRISVNDLWGSLQEVHFYGNDEYITVIIRTTATRFGCLSFGMLDEKGLTTPRVAYAVGNHFSWWSGQTASDSGGISRNCHMSTNEHRLFINRDPNTTLGASNRPGQFRIPNGVLDTSLGFPSGDLVVGMSSTRPLSYMYGRLGGNSNENISAILDFAVAGIENQPTTGGVPLYALPIIYSADGFDCYLGEIPDLRYANITNIPSGDELLYGSDLYQFFPLKSRGSQAAGDNSSPAFVNAPNTYYHGLAVRKRA